MDQVGRYVVVTTGGKVHTVVTRGRRLKTKVCTCTRRYVWTRRLGRYLGRNEGTNVDLVARQ